MNKPIIQRAAILMALVLPLTVNGMYADEQMAQDAWKEAPLTAASKNGNGKKTETSAERKKRDRKEQRERKKKERKERQERKKRERQERQEKKRKEREEKKRAKEIEADKQRVKAGLPAQEQASQKSKKQKAKKEKKKKGKGAVKGILEEDINYNKLVMEEVYGDISGFPKLPESEESHIVSEGGAHTYGEITYDGLQKILYDLNLDPDDVFFDLGSGVGKAVMQVYLNTPVKKSIGVELSQTRHDKALQALQRLKEKDMLEKGRKLEFHHENILNANMRDATVVYTCSTCFSDDLMASIAQKLSKLKSGLRFLTLKELKDPEKYGFKKDKVYMERMTWSPNDKPVHMYILE